MMTTYEKQASSELYNAVMQLMSNLLKYETSDDYYEFSLPEYQAIVVTGYGVFLVDTLLDCIITEIDSSNELMQYIPLWHDNYKVLTSYNLSYAYKSLSDDRILSPFYGLVDTTQYTQPNNIIHLNVTWVDRILRLV